MGKYERQYFVGIDPTLPEDQRRALSRRKEGEYLALILSAFRAEKVEQSPPFHGRKGNALVLVGPVDAPLTRGAILEAVYAAKRMGVVSIDCLGFEFEMGLIPQMVEEARQSGVRLALRYIPKDVFDKRAVEKKQIVFYDVAYLEARVKTKGLEVTVTLADFGVSYRQDDADVLAGEMKPGGSKVTVDAGQVVKLTKDKAGVVKREVLTKKWTDWIDYWSVDFDYHAKQEILTVTLPDATGRMVNRPQWTGGYIFENEWQSFRTRRDRTLELTSAPHAYDAQGPLRHCGQGHRHLRQRYDESDRGDGVSGGLPVIATASECEAEESMPPGLGLGLLRRCAPRNDGRRTSPHCEPKAKQSMPPGRW